MKHTPPKCSGEWTLEERNKLAAYIVSISLDRIERDDPGMPVLAKLPIFDVLKALYLVLAAPTEALEANRVALEKEYDSANDRHSVWVSEL